MKLDERRQMLLALLKKTGALTVAEVHKQTHLSANTIARDLAWLAAAGYLIKVPGGAVPVMNSRSTASAPLSFDQRRPTNEAAKRAIAKHLAGIVAPAQTVALDASSTVFALCECLEAVPEKTGQTIFTNGVQLFLELQRRQLGFRLLLSGGEPHPQTGTLAGPVAQQSLKGLHFDCVVVSAAGLMQEQGDVTDATPEGAAVKKTLLAHADQTVLALDTSKLNFLAPYKWATLWDFNLLVTEEGPRKIERKNRPEMR